jgi:hypothetical protein
MSVSVVQEVKDVFLKPSLAVYKGWILEKVGHIYAIFRNGYYCSEATSVSLKLAFLVK